MPWLRGALFGLPADGGREESTAATADKRSLQGASMGSAEDSIVLVVMSCLLFLILYACVAYIRSDRGEKYSPDLK